MGLYQSSYTGFGGLLPVGAGYGSLPGVSGPTLPGGKPNSMGGYDYTVQNQGPAPITPWVAPYAQPVSAGGMQGTPAQQAYQAFAPGGQVQGYPGQAPGSAIGTAASGGTIVPIGNNFNGQAGQGSNYLSGLLGQIGSQPGPSIPPLPDLGNLPQGEKNILNYTNYLQNQANAVNNQDFNWAVQALQGSGTSAKTDIAAQQADANAQNQQDMISKGLTNSTIEPTLKLGTADEAQRANQRVDEGVSQQLINLLQSRNVQGPTMAQMFQMMQGASAVPNTNMINSGGGNWINYLPPFGAKISY